MSEWIPLSEAAALVDLNPQTLRNRIREGALPATKKGKLFLVRRSEVLALFTPPAIAMRRESPNGASPQVARRIVVANQKGGCGKTTTVQALGTIFARNYRTLCIDMDPQGNLTSNFGVDLGKSDRPTVAEVLLKRKPLRDALIPLPFGKHFHLIGSDLRLAAVPQELKPFGNDFRLRDAVTPVLDDYDFVIVDTAPALDLLVFNAIVFSTDVIVPIDPGSNAILGVNGVIELMKGAEGYNPNLKPCRFLATRQREGEIASRETIARLERSYGSLVFDTVIRDRADVRTATVSLEPFAHIFPNSEAAKDYEALAEEIIRA